MASIKAADPEARFLHIEPVLHVAPGDETDGATGLLGHGLPQAPLSVAIGPLRARWLPIC